MAAIFALAEVPFLRRTVGRIFRRRTAAAVVLLAFVPAATVIPALAALGLVSSVCVLLVDFEAIARREHRVQIRHPELAD